jgi:hypothetical protein
MKLICGVLALAAVPVAFASSHAPYPESNVAEFVFEKLDVTTLPSAMRPKHAKGKKTFADYGYVASQVDENNAHLRASTDTSPINMRVLEHNPAGIYVCVASQSKQENIVEFQRVVLLKLKNSDGLLKGRESSKEFERCPAIGSDPASETNSYGG